MDRAAESALHVSYMMCAWHLWSVANVARGICGRRRLWQGQAAGAGDKGFVFFVPDLCNIEPSSMVSGPSTGRHSHACASHSPKRRLDEQGRPHGALNQREPLPTAVCEFSPLRMLL